MKLRPSFLNLLMCVLAACTEPESGIDVSATTDDINESLRNNNVDNSPPYRLYCERAPDTTPAKELEVLCIVEEKNNGSYTKVKDPAFTWTTEPTAVEGVDIESTELSEGEHHVKWLFVAAPGTSVYSYPELGALYLGAALQTKSTDEVGGVELSSLLGDLPSAPDAPESFFLDMDGITARMSWDSVSVKNEFLVVKSNRTIRFVPENGVTYTAGELVDDEKAEVIAQTSEMDFDHTIPVDEDVFIGVFALNPDGVVYSKMTTPTGSRKVRYTCPKISANGGIAFEGTCWYLAGNGQSCSAFCSSHYGYHESTATTGIKDEDTCGMLLDRVAAPGEDGEFSGSAKKGLGCYSRQTFEDGKSKFRRYKASTSLPEASDTDSEGTIQRLCSCNG